LDPLDEPGMTEAVLRLWHAYRAGETFSSDEKAVNAYTREAMTRRLTSLLEELVRK
jgi:hypothetical protein